jgi:flagellin-like protein
MKLKGISPLIASVLLIAFTMAIAGIMATWATTFSTERLATASGSAECIGILDISSLSYNNGTVSVKIKNIGELINLTGLRATLEYSDSSKNKEYILKDYNVTDPLQPASTTWFTVNTGVYLKPLKIEVISLNCPKHSASLNFR